MNPDDPDFILSQMVDGTLPPGVLASPGAAVTLSDYRRVDALLRSAAAVPGVDFDALRRGVWMSIDESVRPAVAGRIGWVTRSALAASIMAVIGVGIWAKRPSRRPAAGPAPVSLVIQRPVTPSPIVVVGPAAQSPVGPGLEDIRVGPSPAFAARPSGAQLAVQDAMPKPSKIVIADRPMPRPHR